MKTNRIRPIGPVIHLVIWCNQCWFRDDDYSYDETTQGLLDNNQEVANLVHSMMRPGCVGKAKYLFIKRTNAKLEAKP